MNSQIPTGFLKPPDVCLAALLPAYWAPAAVEHRRQSCILEIRNWGRRALRKGPPAAGGGAARPRSAPPPCSANAHPAAGQDKGVATASQYVSCCHAHAQPMLSCTCPCSCPALCCLALPCTILSHIRSLANTGQEMPGITAFAGPCLGMPARTVKCQASRRDAGKGRACRTNRCRAFLHRLCAGR
eukprot:gene14009-biopygen14143